MDIWSWYRLDPLERRAICISETYHAWGEIGRQIQGEKDDEPV